MDPEATWKVVSDDTLATDERAEAALNLLVWIAKGGTPSLYIEGLRPTLDAIDMCESVLSDVLDLI